MKFSTKSRYALRLMAELARYAPGTTVSLKEISERQNLSLKYLEQIVTPLARVGLVKSERGSRTGRRSADAAQKLEAQGYTGLRDLGGILSWPYEIEGDFEGHF